MLENLSRLASKPGVEHTLVLSKTDGSIIRSSRNSGNVRGPALSVSGLGNGSGDERQKGITNYDTDTTETPAQKPIEDIARMVFSFMSAAGALIEDMDSEDDLKLLRLRTRKNEIIIVPGQSVISLHSKKVPYIFCVYLQKIMHDMIQIEPILSLILS